MKIFSWQGVRLVVELDLKEVRSMIDQLCNADIYKIYVIGLINFGGCLMLFEHVGICLRPFEGYWMFSNITFDDFLHFRHTQVHKATGQCLGFITTSVNVIPSGNLT